MNYYLRFTEDDTTGGFPASRPLFFPLRVSTIQLSTVLR